MHRTARSGHLEHRREEADRLGRHTFPHFVREVELRLPDLEEEVIQVPALRTRPPHGLERRLAAQE
eukprot:6211198-Pleurochrysis_carterae.AAC.10